MMKNLVKNFYEKTISFSHYFLYDTEWKYQKSKSNREGKWCATSKYLLVQPEEYSPI